MKKALIIALTLFSVPFSVSAATVYQQFTDSSGTLIGQESPTTNLLASFQPPQSVNIVSSEIQLSIECNYSGVASGNLFNIYVGTTTGNPNDSLISFPIERYKLTCGGVTDFVISTSTTLTFPAITTYTPGVVYYVWTTYSNTVFDDGDFNFITNLSEDFYYGYLTAGGFALSGVIDPGLFGYTDVGISTTSQQVYCQSNFSTSTGLLDSLGSSISLALCNTGVFLFIPNTQSINSFANNWSSLSTTKFPFAWVTDFRTLLDSFATTSEAYFELTIDFGTTTEAIGISNLTVISTSTLSYFLSDSTRNLLKILIASVFYLLAVSYIYRDIQGIWHKQV